MKESKYEHTKICKKCGFEYSIISDAKYIEPTHCKACKEPYQKNISETVEKSENI